MEDNTRWPAVAAPAIVLGAVGLIITLIALATVGKADKAKATALPPAANIATVSHAASDLRSRLNVVLAEHVALACDATGAALGGRDAEFKAAANSLEGNSVALAKIIGAAYGPDAEAAFVDGWRSHIGLFVDYTTGSASNDGAVKAKAVAGLHQYAIDVADLFNRANDLPPNAIVQIMDEHVRTVTAVIDAQAAKDPVKGYSYFRISVGHMQTLADPLADATVRKFPDKFAGP